MSPTSEQQEREALPTLPKPAHWTEAASWVYTADQMHAYARAALAATPAPGPHPDTQDAERYRWLMGEHAEPLTKAAQIDILDGLHRMSSAAVDAAIDAAMKEANHG